MLAMFRHADPDASAGKHVDVSPTTVLAAPVGMVDKRRMLPAQRLTFPALKRIQFLP